MRIAAVKALYFTGAGTTRLVTERLAERCGLPAEAADVTPRGAVPPAFGEHDLAVFAVPSYGGRVPAPMLERIACCAGRDTPAVLLVTYGNRAIDDTLLELADAVRERGFVPVGAAAVVAHHSLMTNVAEDRPDEKDLAVVDELARVALARLSAAPDARSAELSDVPGGRPYREFGGVPFHPETDATRCVSCGACAEQCPTGAIDPDEPARTEVGRCVSCFRCVVACATGARRIGGGPALAAARAAFAVKCARRQESYLIGG